jgi:hypothetical protein
MKKVLLYSVCLVLLASCSKTQFTPASVSEGSADFTTYISVGNSLTQGYMDDGLYEYGQSHSYPSTLAAQMKLALPGMSFVQPMTTGNGSGHMFLAYVNGTLDPIAPTDSSYLNPDGPDPSWTNWGSGYVNTQVNNMGISGVRLTDCVAMNFNEKQNNSVVCGYNTTLSLGNPFGRFLNFGTFPAPIQYLDHIKSSKATFFTCWLGDNDVLGYALSGGVLQTITLLTTDTLNQITSPSIFAAKYDSVLTAFHNLGAKGVCMTIPNVTSIPFFNTVPQYVMVNGQRKYFYITTASGVRQATDNDFILLSAYDSVQQGWGTTAAKPLNNDLVLDETEAAAVESATLQYNASIKSLAAKYGFGVVDMFAFMETMQTSITIDGITFSRAFIQGGTFGLDGIHPNARGYAVVANQIIDVINKTYNSTLPQVDVTKFKGCIFPTF